MWPTLPGNGRARAAAADAVLTVYRGRHRDVFAVRSQPCYQRWEPEAEAGFVPPTMDELSAVRPELADSPVFTVLEHHLYEQVNRYTTASYLEWLARCTRPVP